MTFRPESLESEWEVFQRLLCGSGFKVRKLSDFGVFLCAHPYYHLSSEPTLHGTSLRWVLTHPTLNREPSRHGLEGLLQTSGLLVDTDLHVLQKPVVAAALTTAMRAKPNGRELRPVWGGDKPLPDPTPGHLVRSPGARDAGAYRMERAMSLAPPGNSYALSFVPAMARNAGGMEKAGEKRKRKRFI